MSFKNMIFLSETDSTNNYANQLIMTGTAEEGTVVLTLFQNRGRGYAGNSWESEAGKNVLMSLILFPEFLDPAKQFYLSMVVSLGLCDVVSAETPGVSVKWPNDLYVNDKKIAGILIENSVAGERFSSAVAGIGLNLNQVKFLSDAPNPVSLCQLTGKTYDFQSVASNIAIAVQGWYNKLKDGKFKDIKNQYLSHLYRKEKWALYQKGNCRFEARPAGIGEYGQLLLEDRSGKITGYMFKEIEFVY